MSDQYLDKHPWRHLSMSIAAGVSIFMAGFFVLQMSLQISGIYTADPSVWNFYWLMALAGGIFGFERWWGLEQGSFNPHDR